MQPVRRDISRYRKIVIKIGTNALIENGRLHGALLRSLCAQMYKLRQQKRDIIIITSGAIGVGAHELDFPLPVVEITQRQACAAVGQPLLMYKYREAFMKFKQPIGQVLLTREVLRNNRRSLHLRNTIETLLADNVIPICNENDSVATEELEEKIRDNDLLGVLLARNFAADLFVVLSDTEGLYAHNPPHKDEKPIPTIERIDNAVMSVARSDESGSKYGTGGMYSKLQAIKLACHSHCSAIITSARIPRVLLRLFSGEVIGSYFPAQR